MDKCQIVTTYLLLFNINLDEMLWQFHAVPWCV